MMSLPRRGVGGSGVVGALSATSVAPFSTPTVRPRWRGEVAELGELGERGERRSSEMPRAAAA